MNRNAIPMIHYALTYHQPRTSRWFSVADVTGCRW